MEKREQWELALAEYICKMQVARPEVLRATAAHRIFERCGAALWPGSQNMYFKSRQTERIQEFWTHSWSSSPWKKYLTLLLRHNGPPALVLGTASSALGTALVKQGLSLAFGAAGVGLALAFWRSGKMVFLDRMCINQADGAMKMGALCSLAGLVNKSDSMLVLWDVHFAQSLWCMFEVTAFLKSSNTKPLTICPITTGPCSMVIFLTVFLASVALMVSVPHAENFATHGALLLATCLGSAYAVAHMLRVFYRSVESMQRQLHGFELKSMQCACCAMSHVNSEGEEMVCDREVITMCICRWFGSCEDFERYVRSEVCDVLTQQLHSAFGPAWCCAMATPAAWAVLDLLWIPVRSGDWQGVVFMVTVACILCLLIFPILVSWTKCLAYLSRSPASSRCREAGKNVLVLLCSMPIILYVASALAVCSAYEGSLERTVVFCGLTLPAWAVMRALKCKVELLKIE